jgi:excisionase family DNA binding protein
MTPTTIVGEVYTVEEVAAIFRVPVGTVRRMISRGELPALHLGRSVRVPKSVVVGLLERPVASYLPEELGFGMWAHEAAQVDSVAYVDRVRNDAPNTLREYLVELWND